MNNLWIIYEYFIDDLQIEENRKIQNVPVVFLQAGPFFDVDLCMSKFMCKGITCQSHRKVHKVHG